MPEKERGIRLGPVRIGIGKKEEEKRISPLELQSKLSYTMKRLEKKAETAEAKYEQKREHAKDALRKGHEDLARMRLKSAQLQKVLSIRARNSSMAIEAVKDRLEQVQDYRDLQETINELGVSLGDLVPEKMMGSVQKSMAELERIMTSAEILGEKMGEELATVTTGEIPEPVINEEMAKLAEEVQAEAAEELKPVEIEERAEAVKEGKEKEEKAK